MAAQDRLIEMLIEAVFPPTSPEEAKKAMVFQLTELADLRVTELTEDEWSDWRRSILDGLAADIHLESGLLIGLALYGPAAVGLLAYCAWIGAWQWVWGVGGSLVFALLMGWRLLRARSAKRRLTPADRLAVVEELVTRTLVSSEEAVDLRDRIAALSTKE